MPIESLKPGARPDRKAIYVPRLPLPVPEHPEFRSVTPEDILPVLLIGLTTLNPDFDARQILAADQFADDAFFFGDKVFRDSGNLTITHAEIVAMLLVCMEGIDDTTIAIAAENHDVVEDTHVSLEQMATKFGNDVAQIVDLDTKIKYEKLEEANPETTKNRAEAQKATLEKIYSSLTKDFRAILVKLADVAHNQADDATAEKAHIALDYYYNLALQLGTGGFATMIGDYALYNVNPKRYREIVAFQEQHISNDLLYELHRLTTEWLDQSNFYEEESAYSSISVSLPTIYEIHQKASKQQVSLADVSPHITVVCPDETKLFQWLTFLAKKYPHSTFNTLTLGEITSAEQMTKILTIDHAGQTYQIPIHLLTTDMQITPKDLLNAERFLSPAQAALAAEKFDRLAGYYQGLLTEPQNVPDVLNEALKQGNLVKVYTPKGDPKILATHATVADFAFQVGQRLGYSAVGARINGSPNIVPLNTRVHTGDTVEIVTGSIQITPEHLDWVVERKSQKDILTRLPRTNKEIRSSSRLRAKRLLMWLYESKTGSPPDIHLERGFDTPNDDFLKAYYGSFDFFLEKLGFVPRPALARQHLSQWPQEDEKDLMVKHAVRLVDNLIKFRKEYCSVEISIRDQPGVVLATGTILGMLQINTLPVYGTANNSVIENDTTTLHFFFHPGTINLDEIETTWKSQLETNYGENVQVKLVRP